MYTINPNYSVLLAQGDTMNFVIKLTTTDGEPATFPDGTVAIFAISKEVASTAAGNRTAVPLAAGVRVARISAPPEYVTAFKKVFKVQTGGIVLISLTNAETRNLETGDYLWDVRIVTDPEYDDQGDVKCDDNSDQVVSIFSGGIPLPKFTITEVITIV